MISSTLLHAVAFFLFRGGESQWQDTADMLPVTFYLPTLATADSSNPGNAVYYYAHVCSAGVAGRQQANLHIFESNNVDWNTANKPYVVAQVSVCENDFGPSCVIATNYQYTSGGSKVDAQPNISWTMQNETAYFIRAMGGYVSSVFSMELSFSEIDANQFAYPYTLDVPFMSQSFPPSKQPVPMAQYWKTMVADTVENGGNKSFALAYCDQGTTVKGIEVVVSSVPDTSSAADFSLMQQWACPQTTPLSSCTTTEAAYFVGWANQGVASFNVMTCAEDSTRTTKNGIFVLVGGYGANKDESNSFVLNAALK